MDIFEKIVLWNKERGLLEKKFNHRKEISFIIEELLESTGSYDSLSARNKAELLSKKIILENQKTNEEDIVDAFADIIIFSIGAIAKLGYKPTYVIDEVYKEINSRKGTLVDGKFIKDQNTKKYKANFTKCKNSNT